MTVTTSNALTTRDLPTPSVATAGKAQGSLTGTRRPRGSLLFYYMLLSILAGPGIIVVLPIRFFRFRTLKYVFDPDGVTVRWGILFRREISLTYARIQDIHLVSNVVERWLGLGRVQIQTASGNAAAEMTIEGLPDYEQVRDELYVRMRGARGAREAHNTELSAHGANDLTAVAAALREAAAELRALREALHREPAS